MGASVSSQDLGRDCLNLSAAAPSKYTGLLRFQELYAPVHGYLCVLLCVFGVVANLANIVVLTRKCMASSVNAILIAVAVADLFTMLFYFFQVLHFTILSPEDAFMNQPHTLSYGWIIYSLLTISLVLVLHTVACWLTVALAVFRYLYIALPSRGAQLASSRNAYAAILATYALLCLTNVPNYMVNAPRACYSSATNRTVYFIATPEQLNILLLRSNYWTIAILYKIIPCLALSVMTILLIVEMSKAARRRKKLLSSGKTSKREQKKDSREQRTTMMLLAIVIIFLVTELPQGVMSLLCFLITAFETNVYAPTGDLLDLLSLINNSVNFVLYTTMSKQFRDTFSGVFLSWLPRCRADQPESPPGDNANGGDECRELTRRGADAKETAADGADELVS